MKWLLYQEFNLSQGTCVFFLEKLLILFRHFILQFMNSHSAIKPTVVLPQNDNDTLKHEYVDSKVPETSSISSKHQQTAAVPAL